MKKALIYTVLSASLLVSGNVFAKAIVNERLENAFVAIPVDVAQYRLAEGDFKGGRNEGKTIDSMDQAKEVCPSVCERHHLEWNENVGWYNDAASSSGQAGSICRCASPDLMIFIEKVKA